MSYNISTGIYENEFELNSLITNNANAIQLIEIVNNEQQITIDNSVSDILDIETCNVIQQGLITSLQSEILDVQTCNVNQQNFIDAFNSDLTDIKTCNVIQQGLITTLQTDFSNINYDIDLLTTDDILEGTNKYSQWTTSGTQIYYNDGNVGIGIINPVHKLSVYGDDTNTTPANSGFIVGFSDKLDINGWTGIGLGGYFQTLKSGIIHERLESYGRGPLHFVNNNAASTASATISDARLTILSDGNVGIGTTDPITNLHVKEKTYIGTDVYVSSSFGPPTFSELGGQGSRLILFKGTTTEVPYSIGIENYTLWYASPFTHKWYNNTNISMTLDENGNLGIGETNPEAKLDVVGDIKLTGSIKIDSIMYPNSLIQYFTFLQNTPVLITIPQSNSSSYGRYHLKLEILAVAANGSGTNLYYLEAICRTYNTLKDFDIIKIFKEDETDTITVCCRVDASVNPKNILIYIDPKDGYTQSTKGLIKVDLSTNQGTVSRGTIETYTGVFPSVNSLLTNYYHTYSGRINCGDISVGKGDQQNQQADYTLLNFNFYRPWEFNTKNDGVDLQLKATVAGKSFYIDNNFDANIARFHANGTDVANTSWANIFHLGINTNPNSAYKLDVNGSARIDDKVSIGSGFQKSSYSLGVNGTVCIGKLSENGDNNDNINTALRISGIIEGTPGKVQLCLLDNNDYANISVNSLIGEVNFGINEAYDDSTGIGGPPYSLVKTFGSIKMLVADVAGPTTKYHRVQGDLTFSTSESLGTGSYQTDTNIDIERMRIKYNGNVGIGTISPASKLHIENEFDTTTLLNETSGLFLSTKNATDSWGVGYIGGYIKAGVDNSNGGYPGGLIFKTKPANGTANMTLTTQMVLNAAGNLGIGTTDPDAKLQVSGEVRIQGSSTYMSHYNYGDNQDVYIRTGTDNVGSKVIIADRSTNTYVGIGTTDPQEKLDVLGNARFKSNYQVFISSAGGGPYISGGLNSYNEYFQIGAYSSINNFDNNSSRPLAIKYNGSEIARFNGDGLNISSGDLIFPNNSSLLAAPTKSTYGGNGTRIVFWSGSSGSVPYALGMDGSTLWYSSPQTHKFYTQNTLSMIIAGDGKVGIGDASPEYKLDVNGDFHCSRIVCDGDIKILGNDKKLHILDWRIYQAPPNIDYNNFPWGGLSQRDLIFSYQPYNVMGDYGLSWLAFDDIYADQLDFTGQHRGVSKSQILYNKKYVGYIVSSLGQYKDLNSKYKNQNRNIRINSALPYLELSNKENDPSCFGVISDSEERDRTYHGAGRFKSSYRIDKSDKRVIINSLGEGAIWVSNFNGNIQNGDYITTSPINGIGMRQNSDSLKNYTVAKATCSIDFDNIQTYPLEKVKQEYIYTSNIEISTSNIETSNLIYTSNYDESNVLYITSNIEISNQEINVSNIVVKSNLENCLDSNGDLIYEIQYDENGDIIYEPEYDFKYIKLDGTIIDYNEYNSNTNFIMCMIGATYHCG
jgi:hypothetical protein